MAKFKFNYLTNLIIARLLYYETYLQLHQVLVEEHERCQILVPDIIDGGDIPQHE